MLVEFKFSNFRSFKNEACFSMEPLTRNGENYNTIDTVSKRVPELYRSSAIFGPNASGKSNILLALSFLQYLVKESSKSTKDSGTFPAEFYALSGKENNDPISMEITFIKNNNLYKYSLKLFFDTVTEESLYVSKLDAEKSNQFRRLFERKFDNEKKAYAFDKSTGILQSWSDETIKNRLFLSEIVNNRNCQVAEIIDVYNWISEQMIVCSNLQCNEVLSFSQISKGLGKNIIDVMKKADLGLEDIKVRNVSPDEIIADLRKENKIQDTEVENVSKELLKQNIVEAKSFHKTELGTLKELSFWNNESIGTRKFLSIIGYVLDVIEKGKILVIDEFDSSLHPHLVKYIVSMFNNVEINKNGAQLIFVSHAHYLMDGETLTRDQIWFVSKSDSNGFYSELYSLSDFKKITRKNISFYDAYMDGIYGAVPNIDKE